MLPLPSRTPTPLLVPTATPTLTPVATQEAHSGPFIHYFRASVVEATTGNIAVTEWERDQWPGALVNATPGDTIVFEWDSVGATSAGLDSYTNVNVDTTAVFTYNIEPDWIGCSDSMLWVEDEAQRRDFATLTIKLPCPDALFVSESPICCSGICDNHGCPDSLVVSDAVEQHFENGFMIWVKEQGCIYVLHNDSSNDDFRYRSIIDEWQEGDPDHDPSLTPPPDLYQPGRGFGLVWRENADVRERLGWAVDQESGFRTRVQSVPTGGRHWAVWIQTLEGKALLLSNHNTYYDWGYVIERVHLTD